MTDKDFLKSMHITPEPISPVKQKEPCCIPETVSDDYGVLEPITIEGSYTGDGRVLLSEEMLMRIVQANSSTRDVAIERGKAIQNWIQQARENEHEMKQWRGAFYTLAGGIVAAVGMQVWFWVWG